MRLGGATNDIRRQLFLSYINGAVINNQIILNQKKKQKREGKERESRLYNLYINLGDKSGLILIRRSL